MFGLTLSPCNIILQFKKSFSKTIVRDTSYFKESE